MTVTDPRTAAMNDPDLPAAAVLLGDGVPTPLTAALAAAASTIEEATAAHVTWWPGRSITVRYRAVLGGRLSGAHQIVAVSGNIPEGAVVVGRGDVEIGVWRVPFDPALPGLASAMDPHVARSLMADLGADDGPVRTRLRSYRPGRRAVVEISGARTRVFAKVVPPSQARRIHHTHLALEAVLPVPRSLGLSPDLGVIALQALDGVTLRQAFEEPANALPAPGELNALLNCLPPVDVTSRTSSPIERLPDIAALLERILPEEGKRVARLVAAVGTEPAPATVTSHGDFYEAQLLVDDGAVVGLLDLDTLGLGRRGDDPATMLGHLAVWQAASACPDRVADFAADLLRGWDERVDPADLRRRTAAVVAGLATGPFRVQRSGWPSAVRSRLELAERWIVSADRVDESSLITGSALPHVSPAY